ncbi:MAG: hypothetical protein DRI61_16980 [Chloroflexi bacterium]|nr:MAG: hypothetical protein DRI61_16980 [Chloroflexota bacterium]
MGKVEEFKRKLEKYEEQQKRVAKLFDVKEVLQKSGGIREKYVPKLDMVVRYGPLTIDDLPEIRKGATDEEKALRALWIALRKADPTVTLEDLRKLPLEVLTPLLDLISPLPPGSKTG